MKNKLLVTTIFAASILALGSCNGSSEPIGSEESSELPSVSSVESSEESVSVEESSSSEELPSSSEEPKATFVNVKPITYEDAPVETDMDKFFAETRNDGGSSWDTPHDYGFVKGVWHTLKINDVDIPVYSTRCGNNIHSFAYVDIDTDGAFELDVKVTTKTITYKNAIILPEKKNVPVAIENNEYKFKVNDFGDYTICFGSQTKIKPDKALTIYIAAETKDVVPEGYKLMEFNPGTYDDDDSTDSIPSLRLTQTSTYYRFKKGHYSLNSFLIPDDAIIYFEPGCYFEVRQDDKSIGGTLGGFTNTAQKFKILGRCLADFSHLMGGDAKTKMAYDFNNVKEAHIEGFVSINSNTWTMCYTNCDNLNIERNMLFGYRTYSDGIMLSGCTDSYVHHNFVRTGDDAIEAKATSARKVESNNLLYEYNSVWTDKAKAYGIIYESNADVTDVTFRHNSVGFAQPDWHPHVGCLEIQLGTQYKAVWSNIHFEDTEIYYSACSVMNIWNAALNIFSYGDPAARDYGGQIKNIYYNDVRVKHIETTNPSVPAYMLAINYIVDPKYPDNVDHLKLGKIYIDNAYLGDTLLTKENYESFSLINLDENFIWNTNNIKWNTNPTF